ncbi:cardiolipin synthase [Fusobacterium polymorphum]|uniref:cardiolipin synthase n=1 Tax=Fusobacterium nucleatum subsp. polymorphum TaxID=76857 RepID=UPI00072287CF|nr:cardiolipin synthase [Fusobacterium polymorphum]ALQ42267.1 cardiolipin synthase [Fusobacterium polymorphum]
MHNINEIFLIFINFFLQYVWIANLFFAIVIIMVEKKNPLYTIFWIFLLYLLPYIGFFIYLFFGLTFKKKRVANKIYKIKKLKSIKNVHGSDKEELRRWKGLITYLEMSTDNYITSNNDIQVYFAGEEFFSDLKKEIANAKKFINMEYFIFQFDGIGKEIADLLIKKVKEGVEVNLIIDGVNLANQKLSRYFKNTGVHLYLFFRTYIPIFNIRINYRDHRKVTIIDNRVAFVGGMNIGDEYLGKGKIGYWRDTSVKIYGDIVSTFEKEFYFSMSIVKNKFLKDEKTSNEISLKYEEEDNVYMQVISSGPNYEFPAIRDNYIKLIQEARKSVFIQTPYFVPDDLLLDTLKSAVLSGIDVKIMIPNKADHPFIYWINQYYVAELLRLGANIYRYDNGFIHSKTILVDEEVVSVGTCNFDYRSFYLNFEINLNIYNKDVANSFKIQYYKDIAISKKLTFADFKKRSIFTKVKESVFRLLSPIM